MKKILLAVVILVAVMAGWLFLKNKKTDVVVSPTPTYIISSESTVSPSPATEKNVIVYTDSGYAPNIITIKKGGTVIWKNESSGSMWTASAMHPTHRVYPGTDVSACGTQTLIPMFDSCAGIVSGQSWSFTFKNVGTWKYHDHASPSNYGSVVVE